MPPRSIDVKALPGTIVPTMDFLDSSFFLGKGAKQLPSPASLINTYGDIRRGVILLEKLNMVVKVAKLEEVQTMRAIRQAFPNGEIRVPEVFGWRVFEGLMFMYMSMMEGEPLNAVWKKLTDRDTKTLQLQLREVVNHLREIVQKDPQQIGSVGGGSVQDRFFQGGYSKGPFPNPQTFNDWVFTTAIRYPPDRTDPPIKDLKNPDLLRSRLPDNDPVYFTHADLSPPNIMVSGKPGSYRLSGIIDWEQSGWCPRYWEYAKMHWCAIESWEEDDWPGKIAEESDENAYQTLMEYSVSLGI